MRFLTVFLMALGMGGFASPSFADEDISAAARKIAANKAEMQRLSKNDVQTGQSVADIGNLSIDDFLELKAVPDGMDVVSADKPVYGIFVRRRHRFQRRRSHGRDERTIHHADVQNSLADLLLRRLFVPSRRLRHHRGNRPRRRRRNPDFAVLESILFGDCLAGIVFRTASGGRGADNAVCRRFRADFRPVGIPRNILGRFADDDSVLRSDLFPVVYEHLHIFCLAPEKRGGNELYPAP